MDSLDRLARDTEKRIAEGYYSDGAPLSHERPSLVDSIEQTRARGQNPVIAEVKLASPASGRLLSHEDVPRVVRLYREGRAAGISVLTDPDHFGGALGHLGTAAASGSPALMKDFVIDPIQLDACRAYGGSAVLLISSLYARDSARLSLEEMIERAHVRGLEVLLEVNSSREYRLALETDADMIGINNRHLATLQVDLGVTERVLTDQRKDRLVWALSGIESADDLRRLKRAGADAFLVGTSLMRQPDPGAALRELVRTP